MSLITDIIYKTSYISKMAMQLSLADINRLKYNLAMQKRKKKPAKKKKPKPLDSFSKKFYYSGFKFGDFVRKIENNEIFSYVRYNDGELTCLFGDKDGKGHNSDKHTYFPEMKTEMYNSLMNPDNWQDSRNGTYYFQLGKWMFEGARSNVYFPWVNGFVNANPEINIKFLPKDPIVRSFYNYPSIFKKFVDVLNTKHLVMVGPESMKQLKILTGIKHYIVVPDQNCYLDQNRIQQEIEQYAEEYQGSEPIVFIFSASMMTNTLIDRLHPTFKGKHFLLDCGSVWVNFLPTKFLNRGYMKKHRKKWKIQYPNWIK